MELLSQRIYFLPVLIDNVKSPFKNVQIYVSSNYISGKNTESPYFLLVRGLFSKLEAVHEVGVKTLLKK